MSFTAIPTLPDLPAEGATGDDFNDPMLALLTALYAWTAAINTLSGEYASYVSAALSATSSTSLAIGTGSKAFTIGTGYAFTAGQVARAASAAAPGTDYMDGTVTSYSAGVLTVSIASGGNHGSGTHTDWQIGLIPSASNAILQGTHTIPVLAGAMTPRTTNGPSYGSSESSTNKVMTPGLDFDAATAEYAQALLPMPKSWDGGTIQVQFGWRGPSGTGNVVWGAQAVAVSDDDVIDAAFGTAQTVTDGVTATTDLMWSAYTSAITIAGTPASEDMVVLQVYRDAANGSDTLASDARLLAIRVKCSINAADDS